MVYCVKCGTENEGDAKFCVNCGAALHPEKRREKREDACFEQERRVEEECFGLPYGGAVAGIVFGAFIIILGIAIFLGEDIGRWIGPLTLIVIGLLIVAGAVHGLSRRHKG